MKNASKYLAAALIGLLLGFPNHAQAKKASSSRFSDQEIEKLKNGKQVVRSHPKSGKDSLIGGTSFILVNAPPQEVFEEFNTVENWTEIFPHTYESKALVRKDNAVAVKLRVGVPMIQASVYLTMIKKPDELQTVVNLNKTRNTGIVHDVESTVRFLPQPGNRTLVICSIMTRTAFSAFVVLLGEKSVKDLERNLLAIPKNLKKWVERDKAEDTES